MVKEITLYRNDFQSSAEANFFDDILQELKIAEDFDMVDEVTVYVETAMVNDKQYDY